MCDPDAGFAVLILTLPILERYVRRKVTAPNHKLSDDSRFYDELVRLLPDFKTRNNAIEFWRLIAMDCFIRRP